MRKMACSVGLGSLLLAVAWLASAQDDGRLRFTASPGRLTALRVDGTVTWKVDMADVHVPIWRVDHSRRVTVVDGATVNAQGTLLARGSELRGLGSGPVADGSAALPAWDPLTEIVRRSFYFTSPLFDSLGNAWVLLTDGLSLRAVRSDGHTGTWAAATLILRETDVFGLEASIDPQDRITVVFRSIVGVTYQLRAIHYDPQSGWGNPGVIYQTPAFFQAIEMAADAQGNVVVIFDPEAGDGSTEIWTVVYDAATQTWGEARKISLSGHSILLPTVAQNRAGEAIEVLYLVRGSVLRGLHAHRFDSGTKAWSEATLLPGSWPASFSFAGPVSRYPVTVDDDGNVTAFWPARLGAVYGSRKQGGVWQQAHRLLTPGETVPDLENFADADSSDGGTAWGVITRAETGANRLYAFRYDTTEGWQPAENPHSIPFGVVSTRVRICVYQGEQAIATFLGVQDGFSQLVSLPYDGTSWQPDLLDIPGEFPVFFQESTADRGEALLVFDAEGEAQAPGIVATWLRTPGVSDVHGD